MNIIMINIPKKKICLETPHIATWKLTHQNNVWSLPYINRPNLYWINLEIKSTKSPIEYTTTKEKY